jgi:hypothetical protein
VGWEVDDIEATVATLKERGVVFEDLDGPGLRTVDGIAEIEGNYPSKAAQGRARRLVSRQRGQHARARATRAVAGSVVFGGERLPTCSARFPERVETGAP